MTKRNLGVAGVFLLGCATGGASSQLMMPPAHAQVLAVNSWEHSCTMGNSNELAPDANKLGSDGWEMVGLSHIAGSPSFQVCFKRPRR